MVRVGECLESRIEVEKEVDDQVRHKDVQMNAHQFLACEKFLVIQLFDLVLEPSERVNEQHDAERLDQGICVREKDGDGLVWHYFSLYHPECCQCVENYVSGDYRFLGFLELQFNVLIIF